MWCIWFLSAIKGDFLLYILNITILIISIIGYKNLHLVEKSPKKSAFLENCKLRLGLDCTIHNKPLAEVSLSNVQYVVARAFAPIAKILSFTKQMVNDQTQYVLLKGKSYLEELKLVNNKSFSWRDFPSITSDESRIIVLQTRWLLQLLIKKEVSAKQLQLSIYQLLWRL